MPQVRAVDGSQLVRQSGLTGLAALAAVLSGLLLDVVTVGRFGAGRDLDAFVVAARLPLGILAMLIATANQTLVPTFSRWIVEYGRDRTARLAATFLLRLGLVAGAGAALLATAAGPLTALLAPGFDPATRALAAELVRVTVLVIPLTAGSEVLRAYLNARFSFVLPAAMTVVLNVVSIAVILALPRDIHVVPLAYVAGQAAQFAVMLAFSWHRGLRAWPTLGRRAPEVTAAARRCLRPLLASGLNPLVRVVELLLASYLPVGSATVLHYGNRLISAVGGTVLFRSVTVAVVPRLTRAVSEGRWADADRLVVLGARILVSIGFALTAFTVALAEPATRLVFHRGQFDERDATTLGVVLAVYAGSLVGSALQRALLCDFYARLDTRTPLRNTVYGIVANLLLMPPFVLLAGGGAGPLYAIAAAYSVAQYVNVAHAWHRLRRARPTLNLAPVRRAIGRSAVGAVAATGVMVAIAAAAGLYGPASTARLVVGLVVAAAAGGLVVVLGEGVGRAAPLAQLRALRRERVGPGGPTARAPQ